MLTWTLQWLLLFCLGEETKVEEIKREPREKKDFCRGLSLALLSWKLEFNDTFSPLVYIGTSFPLGESGAWGSESGSGDTWHKKSCYKYNWKRLKLVHNRKTISTLALWHLCESCWCDRIGWIFNCGRHKYICKHFLYLLCLKWLVASVLKDAKMDDSLFPLLSMYNFRLLRSRVSNTLPLSTLVSTLFPDLTLLVTLTWPSLC